MSNSWLVIFSTDKYPNKSSAAFDVSIGTRLHSDSKHKGLMSSTQLVAFVLPKQVVSRFRYGQSKTSKHTNLQNCIGNFLPKLVIGNKKIQSGAMAIQDTKAHK